MAERIYYKERGTDAYYKVWHASERNMIIFMHTSGGSLVCGEKTFPIQRGALCFVGSEVYHYTMPEEPREYVRSKVFVTNEELRSLLALVSQTSALLKAFGEEALVYARVPDKYYNEIERIFEEVAMRKDGENFTPILLSAFLRLLVCIDENRIESISHESGFLERAISYINAHITDKLEIEDICEAVHVSKYHFCREFKKRTGQTVMEYILATRTVLAKNMLRKSDLGVGEISERCGFSSISYFCRAFKQDTGKTPLQFKRSEHKKERTDGNDENQR